MGRKRFWRLSAPTRREWRRNLQLRIVTITLVASSVLVCVFGWFVADRSAKILLNRAQAEVESQMNGKVQYAYDGLNRVTTATGADPATGNPSSQYATAFQYDAAGNTAATWSGISQIRRHADRLTDPAGNPGRSSSFLSRRPPPGFDGPVLDARATINSQILWHAGSAEHLGER